MFDIKDLDELNEILKKEDSYMALRDLYNIKGFGDMNIDSMINNQGFVDYLFDKVNLSADIYGDEVVFYIVDKCLKALMDKRLLNEKIDYSEFDYSDEIKNKLSIVFKTPRKVLNDYNEYYTVVYERGVDYLVKKIKKELR